MKPGMENVWSTGVDPNILQYPENWLGGHLFDPILKKIGGHHILPLHSKVNQKTTETLSCDFRKIGKCIFHNIAEQSWANEASYLQVGP